MKFSKERFLKHACKSEIERYQEHLELLNGKQVEHGSMIRYNVDGKPCLMYPIRDEWCDK